jgi:hypothetical protein
VTMTVDKTTRALNHVELVYAPGERAVARAFFELLGCTVHDSGGPFLSARIESGLDDLTNNCMYASEVTPEQWTFEQSLRDAIASGPLAEVEAGWVARFRHEPQRSCHFGIRFPNLDEYDAMLDRIEHVDAHAPELSKRVSLSGVFRPGDPGSYTDTMVQAFVRTDVVATGLLTFGQHIELQWQVS